MSYYQWLGALIIGAFLAGIVSLAAREIGWKSALLGIVFSVVGTGVIFLAVMLLTGELK